MRSLSNPAGNLVLNRNLTDAIGLTMKTTTFVIALMAATALPSAAKTEPQRAANFQKACTKCGCSYYSTAIGGRVTEGCGCKENNSAGYERSTCFTNATGIKNVSQNPGSSVFHQIRTIELPARKN